MLLGPHETERTRPSKVLSGFGSRIARTSGFCEMERMNMKMSLGDCSPF